jgi:hypothetical protein
MASSNEKDKSAKKEKAIADQKRAYRALLEERAANNGTMIIHKNGRSVLVYARKLLDELISGEDSGKQGIQN